MTTPAVTNLQKAQNFSTAKIIEKTGEIGCIIHNDFLDDFCQNYIQIGTDDTCLCDNYLNYAESIENFEIRNDDIIVASYPKAGTTWTQEMVWMIANNIDFDGAQVLLDKRFPHLELCTLVDFNKMKEKLGSTRPEWVDQSVEYTNNIQGVRFIKTHLPFSLLPGQIRDGSKTPKIIYVIRNPKDVCVSYYHHGRLIQGWRPNFEDFAQVFLADKRMLLHLFSHLKHTVSVMYGSFWKHVLGFWEKRFVPNILLISYEDMKKDLLSVINKISSFLNRELPDEKIPQLLRHLSFECMKTNRAVNQQDKIDSRKKHNLIPEEGSFIRSGNVKKYKDKMSDELIDKFDKWTKQNVEGTSLKNHAVLSVYLNVSTLEQHESLL